MTTYPLPCGFTTSRPNVPCMCHGEGLSRLAQKAHQVIVGGGLPTDILGSVIRERFSKCRFQSYELIQLDTMENYFGLLARCIAVHNGVILNPYITEENIFSTLLSSVQHAESQLNILIAQRMQKELLKTQYHATVARITQLGSEIEISEGLPVPINLSIEKQDCNDIEIVDSRRLVLALSVMTVKTPYEVLPLGYNKASEAVMLAMHLLSNEGFYNAVVGERHLLNGSVLTLLLAAVLKMRGWMLASDINGIAPPDADVCLITPINQERIVMSPKMVKRNFMVAFLAV